ncbi:MAG: DUF547 domain-containing protein, partial [Planctomycetota bacterium]
MNGSKTLIMILAGTMAVAVVSSCSIIWPGSSLIAFGEENGDEDGGTFTYEGYAKALAAYVDAQGLVNYRGLKAGSDELDRFAGSLAKIERETYDGWTEKEKIAFWINAYNALTLEVIIRNYPIRSDALRSLKYPKNSIRQIPGAWTKVRFVVMGSE